MRALHTLLQRWAHEAVAPVRPEHGVAVAQLFSDLGSIATPDVVSLYEAIGGMDMMDGRHWRLWPLAEIRSENEKPSPFGVLFSDYLLSCWCYRLKPNDDQTSAVYVDYIDGHDPTRVAVTLEEFFNACLVNPNLVLHDPARSQSDA